MAVSDDEQYLVHRPDPRQPGISPLERQLRDAENCLADAFRIVDNDPSRARMFALTAEDAAVEVSLDPESNSAQRGDAHDVVSGVKQLRAQADRIDPPARSDAERIARADRFVDLVNTLARSDFPEPATAAVTTLPTATTPPHTKVTQSASRRTVER